MASLREARRVAEDAATAAQREAKEQRGLAARAVRRIRVLMEKVVALEDELGKAKAAGSTSAAEDLEVASMREALRVAEDAATAARRESEEQRGLARAAEERARAREEGGSTAATEQAANGGDSAQQVAPAGYDESSRVAQLESEIGVVKMRAVKKIRSFEEKLRAAEAP